MRRLTQIALSTVALCFLSVVPAEASDHGTVVTHGFTHTEFFPDDICGPRASTVTYTETMAQSQPMERADGTLSGREVSVVTYEVDFVDPALADYRGRLVEVHHFTFLPGVRAFVSDTYHDFGGDLKIWERQNIKIVNGEVLVAREFLKATGCP